MTALIWAPRDPGYPASVWLPGGLDEETGCQLEGRTPMDSSGYIFMDNFTGADGIILPAHAPDVPDSALWQQLSGGDENYLALLDGSLVAPTPQASDLSVYAFPLSSALYNDIRLTGHVGIFDLAQPGRGEFYLSLFDGSGLVGTLKAIVIVPGDNAPATISFIIEVLGASTYYSDPVEIAYCGWTEFYVSVTNIGGTNFNYATAVDGVQTETSATSAILDFTEIIAINVYAAIQNVLPNTIRLADMEIDRSSPG